MIAKEQFNCHPPCFYYILAIVFNHHTLNRNRSTSRQKIIRTVHLHHANHTTRRRIDTFHKAHRRYLNTCFACAVENGRTRLNLYLSAIDCKLYHKNITLLSQILCHSRVGGFLVFTQIQSVTPYSTVIALAGHRSLHVPQRTHFS